MERVLVCILAETRAHQVAWPSFKRHVLDELNADLALAVTIDEKYDYANPFWQHAKYRWVGCTTGRCGRRVSIWLSVGCAQQQGIAPPEWRAMLRIKGILAGRDPISSTRNRAMPQISSSVAGCSCTGSKQDGVLDRYERFIVTRSDFVWLCPHPPLSLLDAGSLWIPDGEDYGGLTDRHLVVARENATDSLDLIHDVLLRPTEILVEEMKHRDDWSPESLPRLSPCSQRALTSSETVPLCHVYGAGGARYSVDVVAGPIRFVRQACRSNIHLSSAVLERMRP